MKDQKEHIHIWVIEDHVVFADTLKTYLEQTEIIKIDHVLNTGEEVFDALLSHQQPDVILLDLGLPDLDGLKLIPKIRQHFLHTHIIVLTVFEDEDKIFQSICAGAKGYLLKSSPLDHIVNAINEVIDGGSPINAKIATKIIHHVARQPIKKDTKLLSDQEREVLLHLADGKVKKEIANSMKISPHTVDGYLRRIYNKLEVNTQGGAIAKAYRSGLI